MLPFDFVFSNDCGIFVIKYAKYMLCNNMKSMMINFDASRARLEITTQLFKHKDIKKLTKIVQPKRERALL